MKYIIRTTGNFHHPLPVPLSCLSQCVNDVILFESCVTFRTLYWLIFVVLLIAVGELQRNTKLHIYLLNIKSF